jgi:PHS family inorganic phosphate transporter-like MFS transporter
VLVAGAGFFIDAYAVYSLNLITTLLGVVFWSGHDHVDGYGGNNGLLPDSVSAALKTSTVGGLIIGQLLFGSLAE